MNNVSKTISWCQWTINPVKGLCPVACPYCYARRLYDRHLNGVFKDPSIRYDPSVFFDTVPDGSRIFVGSTIDLFHPRCSLWNDEIIDYCARDPKNTYIFLTKCPQNLPREWPDNCWVGVSIPRAYDDTLVGHFEAYQRIRALGETKARVKFISFEPLIESIASEFVCGLDRVLTMWGINWVILGCQTPYSKKTAPKIEWVKEIVEAADKAGVPVFLKDNLKPIFQTKKYEWRYPFCVFDKYKGKLRQEFPRPLAE